MLAIANDDTGVTASGADRDGADRSSRSQRRSSPDESTKAIAPSADRAAKDAATPIPALPGQAAQTLAVPVAPVPSAPPPPPVPPGPPAPVAGLSQIQMNNAVAIVAAGKSLGLPTRAFVIAVACALQESNLRNLASTALPESFSYPNEGSGSDHDSVGLFQQRPSSGWGSVKNLMKPDYAAKAFYRALALIPGWATMALTYAAQAVQMSAYPSAYAKHEGRAQTIVNALT